MVADHPKQSTMFTLRTKKQLTTKYSLYFLMFRRKARYPSGQSVRALKDHQTTDLVSVKGKRKKRSRFLPN